LFLLVIAVAFCEVGRVWRRHSHDRRALIMSWGLGVALTAHVVSLFGIAYTGQLWMEWYLLLGIIGSLAVKRPIKLRAPQKLPVEAQADVQPPAQRSPADPEPFFA
jgi:hypothetical protein